MREQEAEMFRQEGDGGEKPPVFENGYVNLLEQRGFSPEAIAIRAREVFGQREGRLEGTLAEYARLKFFNFFARSKLEGSESTEQEIDGIWSEIERMSEVESRSKQDSGMATIGVEVEVPDSEIMPRINSVLSNLLIPIAREEYHSNKGRALVEVSTSFSYSSQVQARTIQELLKLGFIPLEKSDDPNQRINADNLSGYEISDDEPLSLHINLGLGRIDTSLDGNSRFNDALDSVATSVSIAFSSVDRLLSRKTTLTRRKDDARPARVEAEVKVCLQASFLDFRKPTRNEIRATELRDSTVYRLLSEAQSIGTAIRAMCGEIMGETNTQYQSELNNVFEVFLEELDKIFSQYGISAYSLNSISGRDNVVDLMAKTNIQKELRLLISSFSRRVKEIIRYSEK